MHIPTWREDPAEATAPSHRLLVRAGYIRQLTAGHYSLLPLAVRVRAKVIEIIRQEMDRIGAQELLAPTMHPEEIWRRSGRWDTMADVMFRLTDHKGAVNVLSVTNEEIFTVLAQELNSHRQLPQAWYQFQTKFRDEPRPRAGLLRVREFTMKDSYSFDLDDAGLDVSYKKHDAAYRAILTRSGLNFVAVQADSGAMGGSQSQEFMVYAEAGEDLIASCSACDYAANMDKATSQLPPVEDLPGEAPPELVHTPGQRTIEDVGAFLQLGPAHQIKTMAFMALTQAAKAGGAEIANPVVVFLRGDHTVNLAKLTALFPGARELRPMAAEEILNTFHSPAGYLGPIGLNALAPGEPTEGGKATVILDSALEGRRNLVAG